MLVKKTKYQGRKMIEKRKFSYIMETRVVASRFKDRCLEYDLRNNLILSSEVQVRGHEPSATGSLGITCTYRQLE